MLDQFGAFQIGDQHVFTFQRRVEVPHDFFRAFGFHAQDNPVGVQKVIDRGPFAIISERTSPIVGIPVLIFGTAVVLAISGWYFRYTQVTYSAD